ncbi:MAG TPA: serine/threonine-protein kinase, partial [Gemmataceae bacterium]|nr:serine/threonine-protein kinase [Gemmataceae bacterium]
MLVPGYEILSKLRKGGMGVVYKARHLALDCVVALKMIRDDVLVGADALTRFRTEAQAIARLHHSNIVQIHDVGEVGGLPYFSLEFCTGGNLDEKLNGTPLLPKDAARQVEVLARAMHAAHQQNVIHRDLKPANVLLAADGTAKITDFGLAKKLDEVGVTHSGAIMGTPSYMAPEQAAGKPEEVGPLSDVYALGAILYECLTGRPPFKAATVMDTLVQVLADDPVPPRQLQSKTPRDLETICLKCLQKEPGKRYATAADLAEDLRRFQAGEPIRARPVGVVERGWRWCKRYPSRAGLAAAVMLAVAGATAGAVWYQQDRAGRALEHALKAVGTEHDVTGALEEAKAFIKQAAGFHDDPTKWEAALVEARSAVMRADGVLNTGVDDTGQLRRRVDAVLAEMEAAERDRRMIARLEDARFQAAAAGNENGFDKSGAIALYAAAFRLDDKEWDSLGAGEAAARINRRAIREELLAALADWSYSTPNKDDMKRLRRVLQATDPDPASFPNRWNAALEQRDWDTLEVLAINPEMKDQPAARLVLMARGLYGAGDPVGAVNFLKDASGRHPGDFWINFELAYAHTHSKPEAVDEEIRYFTAALTLRPKSAGAHYNLGNALHNKHQLDEAIAEFRKALQIQPDSVWAHNSLGVALSDKHQLDEAIAEYRKALRIQPDAAYAHTNLGNALHDKHQLDEAIAEHRKAIQIQPDLANAHTNLGN